MRKIQLKKRVRISQLVPKIKNIQRTEHNPVRTMTQYTFVQFLRK